MSHLKCFSKAHRLLFESK